MADIAGKKIAILATHGFEQSELEVPLKKLREAGAIVDVVSPESGEIKGWDMKDWGYPIKVDKALGEVCAQDYDAIVLPGGQLNPDYLRVDQSAISFIRDFYSAGKTVAAVLPRALAFDRGRDHQGVPRHILQVDQNRCDQRGRSMA